MNITIWIEHAKETERGGVAAAYPDGMCGALAEIFIGSEHKVRFSSQNLADDGLGSDILDSTDVLLYWAHAMHEKLKDETTERIAKRVSDGMGIIFLHSAHFSKPFKMLMGTSGSLKWREDGKHERLYTVAPRHPIANGIPENFFLEKEEMYGEYFDIPTPDDLIFIGWFPGGEVFRSGFTYHYGKGKIFYFQPGHETFPTYYDVNIRKIIYNAVHWVAGIKLTESKTFVKSTCDFKHSKEHKWLKPKK